MADTKLTALSAIASLALTDIGYVVDDPAGTPVSNKYTFQQLVDLLLAAQADQETGTSITTFVSPGRQHFHPAASKFWVSWTANSTTILKSYNVTSVADTAQGKATVTIATDFSDTNWAPFVAMEAPDGQTFDAHVSSTSAKAAGTIVVVAEAYDGSGFADPARWSCGGFGDL